MTTEKKSDPEQPPVWTCPLLCQQPQQEDEISLVDLINVLIQRKWLIFWITAIVTLGAVFYLFSLPRLYRSEILLRIPPVAEIRIEAKGEDTKFLQAIAMKKGKIFQTVMNSLASLEVQRQLFDEVYPERKGAAGANELFAKFHKAIQVHNRNPKSSDEQERVISVSMEGKEPALLADILNRLGPLVERSSVEKILKEAKKRVDQKKEEISKEMDEQIRILKDKNVDKIRRLEEANSIKRKKLLDKITVTRQFFEKKRQNRIKELEEALRIAKSAEIVEPPDFQPISLYLFGEKVLRAEIKELKRRPSDPILAPELIDIEKKLALLKYTPRIDALRKREKKTLLTPDVLQLQEQLSSLEKIHFGTAKMGLLQIDQPAYPPTSSIQPNRKKMILLALVAGFMVSIFAVFLVNFFEKNIQQKQG